MCVCAADDLPKKKPPALYKPTNPDGLAYLDFSVSTTGMLAGVQVSSALILTAQANRLQPLAPSPGQTSLLIPFIHYFFIPEGNSVNTQYSTHRKHYRADTSL